MSDIFDVSRYILQKKNVLSSWKLQKLCYYAKAWALALGEGEMFPENFEAWTHGPVCYKLFKAHRSKYFVYPSDIGLGANIDLSVSNQDIIDSVLLKYEGFKGEDLERLSHSELPWIITRGSLPYWSKCRNVIKNELIIKYYRSQKKDYEEIEDSVDLLKASRRWMNAKKTFTLNEVLDKIGSTIQDIEDAEDLEFEFE